MTPADLDALVVRLYRMADMSSTDNDLRDIAAAVAALVQLREEVARLEGQFAPPVYEGWGLLLNPPIKHGRACAFVTKEDGTEWRAEDEDCTCGYEWRVRLSTEITLHNAWVKRATEAEAEVARLKMNQRCSAIEQGEVGYPCVFRAEMERAEAEARTKIAEQLLRIAALEAERDAWKSKLLAEEVEHDATMAERDALAKDAELLMLDLSSAWFYGNWKAETYTEREMQEIMERQGYWPTSEPELVTRRVAIDAAREKQT